MNEITVEGFERVGWFFDWSLHFSIEVLQTQSAFLVDLPCAMPHAQHEAGFMVI